MTFAIAIALALAAFGLAVVVFRLPRALWTTLLAALVFGLAGYAWQASPGLPGAPKSAADDVYEDQWEVVDSRQILVGSRASGADHLLTADAYMRRGRFADAAGFLNNVLADNPEDFEAWVALGNTLTEQADGVLTQASLYAFTRAGEIAPRNPAPAYFVGLSLLRQGQVLEAQAAWRSALEQMPAAREGAPDEARAFLADRVARLDAMLVQAGITPADQVGEEPVPDQGEPTAEQGE